MTNRKPKVRYDYSYLIEFSNNNNIILEKDYKDENINRDTIIIGKCINNDCKNLFNICFRDCVRFLNFGCIDCRKKITSERRKQKCIQMYGVEHFMKVKEIKNKANNTFSSNYGNNHELISEKRKKTCFEKYGVEHTSKNKIIQQKIKNTIKEKYGVEHILQNEYFKNKAKQTLITNYGVDVPMKSEKIKDKAKQTLITNYGVDVPMKSEQIKNKVKETCIHNYGVDVPIKSEKIKNKIKETCINKYGVEFPMQLNEIRDKSKKTCLEKYGLEHPLQNPEIAEKSSKKAYSKKKYTFPSGRQEYIQGYENFALDELVQNDKVDENNIITSRKLVPKIWYTDIKCKKHRHYVDIFIPSQNKCIEVKSTWTAKKKKDSIYLKQQAGKDLGYEYEIWIYDGKANKVETIL
jgi:hypothetical protein